MKIIDIYRKKRPVFSVEFFPPKNGEGLEVIFETLDGLKKFNLDYFSVTSGALGSQRGGTVGISALLKKKYGIEGLVHLTGVNKSKQEIEKFIKVVYQKKRFHFSLGYLPPEELEAQILVGQC